MNTEQVRQDKVADLFKALSPLFCRMTVHSGMLAEVLSDWGLLELLLSELRRRAKILRKAGVVSPPQISMNQHICFLFVPQAPSPKILISLASDLSQAIAKTNIFVSSLILKPQVPSL